MIKVFQKPVEGNDVQPFYDFAVVAVLDHLGDELITELYDWVVLNQIDNELVLIKEYKQLENGQFVIPKIDLRLGTNTATAFKLRWM